MMYHVLTARVEFVIVSREICLDLRKSYVEGIDNMENVVQESLCQFLYLESRFWGHRDGKDILEHYCFRIMAFDPVEWIVWLTALEDKRKVLKCFPGRDISRQIGQRDSRQNLGRISRSHPERLSATLSLCT